ncbi:MAG: hypothetical protein IPO83_16850 [Chitinophagaceae bacterium]|nr:hypothetical protein [Chitinophagaceae bacterium]
MSHQKIKRRLHLLILLVIIGLVLSGVTAFPLNTELQFFDQWLLNNNIHNPFASWIHRVSTGLMLTAERYPFIAYGTDWLAFAHLVIATAFLGPLKDPVKNSWVIDWGLIACIMVIPLAFIAGPIREIPLFHRLIDCSFGVIGFILLFICRNLVLQLSFTTSSTNYNS